MPPLVLDGENLGKKHQHYNTLLKEAIDQNPVSIDDLKYEESDIANLLKIDLANHKRDVDYVLNVLKSDDMLYVSRAIKNISWLINDEKYANIINTTFLFNTLFKQMTSKAINKFLLQLRLNLKSTEVNETFYDYYLDRKDLKTALKWLPNCSVEFIKNVVKDKNLQVPDHLVKRLCEKSISILEIYVKNRRYSYLSQNALMLSRFYIYTETEKYFEIVHSVEPYYRPNFGAKATNFIMKVCPQRIVDKFEEYAKLIDIKTFASCLKTEEIKPFLIRHLENEKTKRLFTFDFIQNFLKYMPEEGKFEFLREHFINKNENNKNETMIQRDAVFMCSSSYVPFCRRSASKNRTLTSANIYRWYKYAPFDVAFVEVKKLIHNESSPEERSAMFSVLLMSARHNKQHIYTLLKYYKEKHINETFKFKYQFINSVMSLTKTYRYDEKTWNILNEIFLSLDVYAQSENNVQPCVRAIIVYKVLRDEKVPEVIEKKFSFNSLSQIRKKINKEEKTKVLNYLFQLIWKQVENQNINHSQDFFECVQHLIDVLKLLSDWNQDLSNYPMVLSKIRNLIKIKNDNSWDTTLANIYNVNKSWRKVMFQESLALEASEDACINALKHDPTILNRYKNEIELLCCTKSISLYRFLSKMRIYWSDDLAQEWLLVYKNKLITNSEHKSLTKGLFTLLPYQEVEILVQQYEPKESKIYYSEEEENILGIRKNIAKNMHLTRPQPALDIILLYAKGDYLQYALPSLNSTLHNISAMKYRDIMKELLDAPVSLQKHAIRVAFEKLDVRELTKLITDNWDNSKNASIRIVLFQNLFDLMCRENGAVAEDIWILFCSLIDTLGSEESKQTYYVLGQIKKVPKELQGRFAMKSYNFLRNLQPYCGVTSFINEILIGMKDIMEHLESEFIIPIIKEYVDNEICKKRISRNDSKLQLLSYFLYSDAHKENRNIILNYTLEAYLKNWGEFIESKDNEKKDFYIQSNFTEFFELICEHFILFIFNREKLPTEMFTIICKQLETLDIRKNYSIRLIWKIIVGFVNIIETKTVELPEIRKIECDNDKWTKLYDLIAKDFSTFCISLLFEEMNSYFPSILQLFTATLDKFFSRFHNRTLNRLKICKGMLEVNSEISTNLLVLQTLKHCYTREVEETHLLKDILKTIESHPSDEVMFHYYTYARE